MAFLQLAPATTHRRAYASTIKVFLCRTGSGASITPKISPIHAVTTAPAWVHHRGQLLKRRLQWCIRVGAVVRALIDDIFGVMGAPNPVLQSKTLMVDAQVLLGS